MKRALPQLGFLGVGWIGRNRMEAIVRSGVAEVAMIHDPSRQMIEEARMVAPDARTARSYDEMLDSDLDGIVIATPSALHAEQTLLALDEGFAVFCQKPVGRTAAEVRKVVSAARKADRLLGVDLSYRHTEAMRTIRQRLQNGAIGEIYGVDVVFHNAYGPDKPWFYDPALAGGGCVMDLGVHLIDLALWAMDFPEIKGTTSRLFHNGRPLGRSGSGAREAVEDYALARLDLATGCSVQLACSWNLSAGCDAVISASFYGTRGGLGFRNVNGSFYDFCAEQMRGTSREVLVNPPDAWGGKAAVDWALRLGTDNRFDTESERLVQVAQALDQIYTG